MKAKTKPAEKSIPVPECGCWIWLGHLDGKGYGQFVRNGKRIGAHRAAWEDHNGQPIPEGAMVCHSCDTPSCVNPDHLFLGSQLDNMRDAAAKKRLAAQRKTHCIRGHELAGSNLRGDGRGRRCRICLNARHRERYHKARAMGLGALEARYWHPKRKAKEQK